MMLSRLSIRLTASSHLSKIELIVAGSRLDGLAFLAEKPTPNSHTLESIASDSLNYRGANRTSLKWSTGSGLLETGKTQSRRLRLPGHILVGPAFGARRRRYVGDGTAG